jgi:purine-binding chemotaxis protein CheW
MFAQPAEASSPTTNPPPTLQFLRLALGCEMVAVRIDAVREILEVAQMTPLPRMPAFVRGVMNLRGAVVPVIDLGARVGLDITRLGRRTCVVIADVADPEDERRTHSFGVLVDAVYEVFDVALHELEPVPRLGTRIDAEHLRSMVRVRGAATPELDLHAILQPQVLSQLIAAHAAH